MSDQSQTAANAPSESRLCKMGCGFFGNAATDDCCSKCWREMQKKNQPATVVGPPVATTEEESCKPTSDAKSAESAPVPMDVEPTTKTAVNATASATTPKKKKKASYKNMMASMMKSTPGRNVEQEKESLRNVTGGGAFTKIDKI